MILCAGEALIDMLPAETASGEVAFLPRPGGAVFNTAVALGRLGVRAGFFSGLSTDFFGDMLAATLAQAQVANLARRVDRPTTLAFVALEQGDARYAFYDEMSAARMLTPADLPVLPKETKALFLGGISLVAEPCGSAYEALLAREGAARVTMIDANIRPGFIRDPAAYRARIGRMMAAADIVKLSDEDLRWLMGRGATADLARDVLAMGPKLVLVSEGAEGARGFTARLEVAVPAGKVAVVDTIGAGDAFNAGVLAALDRAGALTKPGLAALDEADLHAALAFGNRVAAATLGRPGADSPWAHEL